MSIRAVPMLLVELSSPVKTLPIVLLVADCILLHALSHRHVFAFNLAILHIAQDMVASP